MFGVGAPWRRVAPPAGMGSGRNLASFWDYLSALLAPALAIVLRSPEQLLTPSSRPSAFAYIAIALVVTVICFAVFRAGSGLTRYFSAVDALNLVRMSATAVIATACIAFLLSRLDSVSRTVPAIHFLLLCALLLGGRLAARMSDARRVTGFGEDGQIAAQENIILVGVNHAAWLYIQFIDEMASSARRVVAILDDREKFVGRRLAGHTVVGRTADLADMIRNFELHGIQIDRIVLAKPSDELSSQVRQVLEDAAHLKHISIESLEQHIFGGAAALPAKKPRAVPRLLLPPESQAILARPYWRKKRAAELALALVLAILTAPLMVIIAGVVAVNLGSPVLFWQQRIGRLRSNILIKKFRTLAAPAHAGETRAEHEARETRVGRILRATRLDELPQLFSIIDGTMSLIGPRPLLPADHPSDSRLRLLVAPGLTGWAQVCGGKLLSQVEKGALDDWYVEHASARVDLTILMRTVQMMLRGDRRDDAAIAAALEFARQRGASDGDPEQAAPAA